MRAKSGVMCLVGMFLLLTVASSFAAEMRTWTRTNGKTFEAEFVSFTPGEGVTLRKADGTEIKVKAGQISEEDRKYVHQKVLSKRNAETKDGGAQTPSDQRTAPPNAEMRKWTIDGKEVEAEFMRFNSKEGIVLKQSDGTEIKIRAPQMCKEDTKYLQKMLAVKIETEAMRKWTIDGNEVEAKLIRYTPWAPLLLEQPDGKKIRVPTPKLSKEDRRYVQQVIKSQRQTSKPKPEPAKSSFPMRTWQIGGTAIEASYVHTNYHAAENGNKARWLVVLKKSDGTMIGVGSRKLSNGDKEVVEKILESQGKTVPWLRAEADKAKAEVAKAKAEAEAEANKAEAARAEARKAKAEAEAMAKTEARKAKAEAEATAKVDKARAEAAKAEAVVAKAEANKAEGEADKARAEAAKAKAELEAKVKAEVEATAEADKARAEAAKAKAEVEAKAKAEVEAKAKADKARAEAAKAEEKGKGTTHKVDSDALKDRLEKMKDAEALLRRILKGFPANCVSAQVVGTPKPIKQDDQKLTARVQVKLEVDETAFEAFRKRLLAVLEEFKEDDWQESWAFEQLGGRSPVTRKGESQADSEFIRVKDQEKDQEESKAATDEVTVYVNTERDKAWKSLKWKAFALDQMLCDVFSDATKHHGECVLSIVSKAGDTIPLDRFAIDDERLGGTTPIADRSKYGNGGRTFFISSTFLRNAACTRHAPTVTIVRDIEIPESLLDRLQALKCEMRFTTGSKGEK